MRRFLLPLCCAAILTGTVAAKDPCPRFAPGDAYPWQTNETMPGDFWTDAKVDVDEKGTPVRCRTGGGNMKREQRFWCCNAILKDAKYPPAIRDGMAIAATYKQRLNLPGRKHREAEKAARKRFFAEHPAERAVCHPG